MSVHVEHGVNQLDAELDGKTVGQVRDMVRQPLNISVAAAAYVNGALADASYTLSDGDTVEFVQPAGKKGDAAR